MKSIAERNRSDVRPGTEVARPVRISASGARNVHSGKHPGTEQCLRAVHPNRAEFAGGVLRTLEGCNRHPDSVATRYGERAEAGG